MDVCSITVDVSLHGAMYLVCGRALSGEGGGKKSNINVCKLFNCIAQFVKCAKSNDRDTDKDNGVAEKVEEIEGKM